MGLDGHNALRNVRARLRGLSNAFDDFASIQSVRNIPRQENGVDCGVFVLQYAKCLAENKPVLFPSDNKSVATLRRQFLDDDLLAFRN